MPPKACLPDNTGHPKSNTYPKPMTDGPPLFLSVILAGRLRKLPSSCPADTTTSPDNKHRPIRQDDSSRPYGRYPRWQQNHSWEHNTEAVVTGPSDYPVRPPAPASSSQPPYRHSLWHKSGRQLSASATEHPSVALPRENRRSAANRQPL